MTLREVLDFPASWEDLEYEEVDLEAANGLHDIIDSSELIDDQIICFRIQESRFPDSYHYIQYFPEDKKIVTKSHYQNSFRTPYLYIFLPLVALFFAKEKDVYPIFILTALSIFIFTTCFLYVSIRSEAKAIERELIIRINYLRRHGNNKNRS